MAKIPQKFVPEVAASMRPRQVMPRRSPHNRPACNCSLRFNEAAASNAAEIAPHDCDYLYEVRGEGFNEAAASNAAEITIRELGVETQLPLQ